MFEPAEQHIPVLSKPLLDMLEYQPDAVIVDCTVGQGGHSLQLASKLNSDGLLIGIDVDPDSLKVAKQNLAGLGCQVQLVKNNFGNIAGVLEALDIQRADIILADIGISSAQLADPNRGISFRFDGPLDMRLAGPASTEGQTAADLVNTLYEKELADIIFQYGEERRSRAIAKAIVSARRDNRIETTTQLVEIINKVFGYQGGGHSQKIHPATRTFQALRIAVNDELGVLERLLEAAPALLNEGGEIAVISFHSLEDRIVKKDFRANKDISVYDIITKKPIIAEHQEIKSNPRSRSAKLRIARKLADSRRKDKNEIESYRRFA
ncbi:MAG: 16S rRNA (cytosine(1402)-N(4))-methyltransferase RsmH [Phycisphaerae bacterium]|nr:16S rRNA (cytosine(1402)-N(4))-methyltransferase RsmH [Phycisphaerae bacterium]